MVGWYCLFDIVCCFILEAMTVSQEMQGLSRGRLYGRYSFLVERDPLELFLPLLKCLKLLLE